MAIPSLGSASPLPLATQVAAGTERASVGASPSRTAKADATGAPEKERAPADAALQGRTLDDVVKEVNDFIKPFNNSLQFSIDDSTGTVVVKVIDGDTQEVIKQIPSDEMLAIAKAIGQLKGLLVKQQA